MKGSLHPAIVVVAPESGTGTGSREARLRATVLAANVLADAATIDPDLAQLAAGAVPAFADWCIVDVVDPDGEIETFATAAVTPEQSQIVADLRRRYPPRPGQRHPTSEVVASGRPVLLLSTSVHQLRERLVDDGHVELVRRLEPTSIISVPLLAHDRIWGAMTFGMGRSSGRSHAARDVSDALEYARLVAAAFATARMRRDLSARARASDVLDRLSDGVAALDTDGRVRLWNRAAARITGIGESAAIGRRIELIVPAWTPDVHRSALESGGQILLPLHRGEGDSERWLSVSGVRWEDGSAFAIRDVTADRQLEQVRHEIVATVSHQLRTPLASVYAAAITLTREDMHLDEEMRLRLLTMIVEQSQRLDVLSQDLLLVHRIDAADADGSIRLELTEIGELVEGIVEAVSLPADEQHRFGVDCPEPVHAMVDVNAFVQVVSNLLDNAVKYSPEGGVVTVRVRMRGGELTVEVRDAGIGIDSAIADRVFDRFYRVDPDMIGGVGGSGIGLYVVRRLVQLMGGSVEIEHLMPGTCFRIRLRAGAMSAI